MHQVPSTKRMSRFYPPDMKQGLQRLDIAKGHLQAAALAAWEAFLLEFALYYTSCCHGCGFPGCLALSGHPCLQLTVGLLPLSCKHWSMFSDQISRLAAHLVYPFARLTAVWLVVSNHQRLLQLGPSWVCIASTGQHLVA